MSSEKCRDTQIAHHLQTSGTICAGSFFLPGYRFYPGTAYEGRSHMLDCGWQVIVRDPVAHTHDHVREVVFPAGPAPRTGDLKVRPPALLADRLGASSYGLSPVCLVSRLCPCR